MLPGRHVRPLPGRGLALLGLRVGLRLRDARGPRRGDLGVHVFTLEKLPELLRIAGETAGDVGIDRLVVMDGGNGDGAANAIRQKPQAMMKLVEQMAGYAGIEPDALLKGLASRMAETDGGSNAAPARKKSSGTPA